MRNSYNGMVKYAVGLVSVIIVLCIYYSTNTLWHNQYDDSLITYRYSINLAEHGQLVFNLGERVDAASSFLYTVVLAGIYKVGVHNLEIVSFVINMLAIALISMFVYLSVCVITKNKLYAVMLALIASCHGFIAGWSALGMDTVLFAALIVMWTYFTLVKHNDLWSTILTICVVLMRMEGMIVLPVWYYIHAYKDQYKSQLKYTIPVFISLVSFYLFKFIYYGSAIPNSLNAKHSLPYYQSDVNSILSIWITFGGVALVLFIVSMVTRYKLQGAKLLGIYVLLSIISCMLAPRSDWVRYTIHLYPLMIIGLSLLFIKLYKPSIIIILLLLTFQCWSSNIWMYHNCKVIAPAQEMRGKVGEWLNNNAVNGSWVVSGDLGEISYKAINCNFIDMIGLVSKDILECNNDKNKIDKILNNKSPLYVADTVDVVNDELVYNRIKSDWMDTHNIKVMEGYKYTDKLAIIVGEVR